MPVPRNKKGKEAVDIRFTYDINGILIADMTVVSTGKSVSRVISQTVSDAELAGKVVELEKLKVHPKDMSENRLVMERLQALFEEAPPYLREDIRIFIQNFEQLLVRQDPRPIKRYREFLEQVIEQIEISDPFETAVHFPEYEEPEDEDWTDENRTDEDEEADSDEDDFFAL